MTKFSYKSDYPKPKRNSRFPSGMTARKANATAVSDTSIADDCGVAYTTSNSRIKKA
jgi:hypothetical protein